MAGEQLMRLLETLDGISLGQDCFELRARRKKAAARINSLMDTNDSVCQIASRGELEMKKILVCDPSLRISLCLSETFFQCVIWTISRSYM